MSRRQAVTSLTAGLVLLVTAPLVWWATTARPAGQSVSTVNAAAAAQLATGRLSTAPLSTAPLPTALPPTAPSADLAPTPAPAPAPETVAQTAISTSPAGTEETATPPAPVPPAAPPPAVPSRIDIPTLGISSPVVPVGVSATGALEIPTDVDEIGWYRWGPAPGSEFGSAVLTGHVDDAQQGPGSFARIGSLQPGDAISVVDQAGTTRAFQVLAREEWSKAEIPLDRLFDRSGSPRLVLITCGGVFDAESGHYEDNIGITAVPVPT